jgi:hypothetical protein
MISPCCLCPPFIFGSFFRSVPYQRKLRDYFFPELLLFIYLLSRSLYFPYPVPYYVRMLGYSMRCPWQTFWLLKPTSDHTHARLLHRLSWSWTVLLPSDTHRKPITSITAVLLPFVTHLLTLSRISRGFLTNPFPHTHICYVSSMALTLLAY